jgi:predicted PurR-regulated permease PerM
MGAFSRNRAERKQWWNERLWLQMVLITIWCFVVFAVFTDLLVALVVTAIFAPAVYVLARWMLRRGY